MDKTGHCKVCPKKCPWNIHYDMDIRHVITVREVWETAEEIKSKMEKELKRAITIDQCIARLEDDIEVKWLILNAFAIKNIYTGWVLSPARVWISKRNVNNKYITPPFGLKRSVKCSSFVLWCL